MQCCFSHNLYIKALVSSDLLHTFLADWIMVLLCARSTPGCVLSAVV